MEVWKLDTISMEFFFLNSYRTMQFNIYSNFYALANIICDRQSTLGGPPR